MRTLTVFVLLLAACAAGAQTVVTIGQNTSNNLWPFRLASSRYQTAYTQAELGVPAGSQLIEVRVLECQQAGYQQTGPVATYDNLRVRLGHTTVNPATGMTGSFDTNYTGSLTTCLGPSNFQPVRNAQQFYVFPLTTPFSYNGTDGIVLDWSFDNLNTTTGPGFYINSPAGRSRINASPGNYQTTTGGVYTGGDWQLQFVFQVGPKLTVVATPGVAQNVFTNETGPSGNGLAACAFTIESSSTPGGSLTSVEITADGTGNDQSAFSHVALYRDGNATNAFEAGGDTLIDTAAASFPIDDGILTFNVQAAEQPFGTTETRKYFIVVKLASNALPGQTFNFVVSNIAVTGTNASNGGVPSAAINGLVIQTPLFVFTDTSPPAAAPAQVGSTGNVCQSFTMDYPGGPDNLPQTLTVTGLGTGHEVNHLASASLWLDANTSNTFETASDTLVDSAPFSADNGTALFSLAALAQFQAGQSRTFFVVYDLNLGGVHNQTFKCYVSAVTGANFGGTGGGLPAPSTSGSAGLVVSAVMLTATLNGPGSALTVQNNSLGVTGSGELLCDVTLSAANGQPWPLSGIIFEATGSAAHDTAFQQLGVHEDTGNGVWDGAGTDGAAAGSLAGFGSGPAFQAVFQLSNGVIPAGQSRRFFLVGRLNGTATSGQTLNARLASISGNLPAGGVQIGFPSLDSTALIIDQSVLTVANAPGGPGNQLHPSGTALSFVMAKYRLSSSNDNVSVSGVTLTGTGNGNWNTAMDAATGVQVYRDNGDGVFDAGTDTLLYQGAGSGSMNAVFTANLDVPTRGSRDIWVRANLLASAGAGASTQQSYTIAIVQTTDVVANTGVLIGTPAPNGAILNVIDFFVTSVDPLTDLPAGGKQLTITGSGFLSPFTVTIDGVVCPGTPTITPTVVSGIQVPPGAGSGKAIVVTSGTLPPLTLNDTFDYVVPGGGKAPTAGGGCIAGATGGLAMLALPILAIIRRRRK